ncbi:D-alanyl-D-alanine carboxypeptidase [Aurantibacter crassamenti]|uniref:D-alanyl-D-alanine carboxypeptidase/D-alanyl-D-alanine-endopeptidase n=1 Tax=Aurantibacter crassamenti TaxID=1837375 RepID=UPI00193A727A|nr:D-alanyl-D-alanine carboxypeptidase [Aurantibacter crassamenti]MBM1107673.1 D-alanyl-D-alanine carboxypeptidase [Aurantibacter crassamenti]
MLKSIKTVHSRDNIKLNSCSRNTIITIIVLLLLTSCSSSKKIISKNISATIHSEQSANHFTGILIIDPQINDTIYNLNSQKYFTPASNTKIFTLYSALKLLPKEIPALKYITTNNTTYIEGTGDPTLFHSYFQNDNVVNFLKDKKEISLSLNNFDDAKYGPGWSWDDYQYYYQPERGSLPLYGNVVTLYNMPQKTISPQFFTDSIVNIHFNKNREAEKNLFYYSTKRRDTIEIPFRTDSTLTRKLLEQVLNKKIKLVNEMPKGEKQLIYSVPTDTVLKRMMHESDNFLAEQLLILGSSTLSDTLNSSTTRNYVLEKLLADLKQEPRWVDGSGLSRYNLFTPESIVQVLQKMYIEIPRERLFDFFPKGGVSGTLEDWYPGNTEPYIFAKTGSLSNNHCLSGYLITKSGKTLIFSFMNNHFKQSSSEIKKRMQHIFEEIRDNY